MSNTLHIIGVPHTVANSDFLVCAFTAKVYFFPDVIIPFGWYVIEYSNEGSESNAHEHVTILSKNRFIELSRRTSREDGHHLDLDNEAMNNEFKQKVIDELSTRAKPGDIVCHVWGPDIEVYNAIPACHHLELSVGYSASPGLPFRIFESSAWMHYHYGLAGQDEDGSNYKWVIPSAFDEEKWRASDDNQGYVLFHGRVTARKGISIIVEIARRMPDLEFHICGPGDNSAWMSEKPDNLHFEGQLFGDARVAKVQNAMCILTPTMYIEPFGFSGVEAQLCGVPQIGSNFGAFQETIIDGVTGFRCNTLADWVSAIRESEFLDRSQIANLARERYARGPVGRQYDQALRQLSDLSTDGWYGAVSRKFNAPSHRSSSTKPRIWLYIPYFGAVPNYFDLYLASLERNADHITVVMFTDIDLTNHQLPNNLISVPMTLEALRAKIAKFIQIEFSVEVATTQILREAYKIVDFKPILPDLFEKVGERLNIAEYDYVGWGDIDVIYGRFDRFINLEADCELIGGFHGHFTALKYNGFARYVYRDIPNIIDLLKSPKIELIDEMVLREPLLRALEERGAKMFYINRYFCDIVPECFVDGFRPAAAAPNQNFFDAYHPDKDIRFLRYERDGKLVIDHRDGSSREAIYCHLQKREMLISLTSTASEYLIKHDGFYDIGH